MNKTNQNCKKCKGKGTYEKYFSGQTEDGQVIDSFEDIQCELCLVEPVLG